MSISTRKARKLRVQITRKIALKRELDAYLSERKTLMDAWISPYRDTQQSTEQCGTSC